MAELVALDIDGTLITTRGLLPMQNVQALQEMHRRGVVLALATARTASGAREILAQLGMPAAIVAEMGATVMNPEGRVVHCVQFSREDAVNIINRLVGDGVDFVSTSNGTTFVRADSNGVKSGVAREFSYERFDFGTVSRIVIRGRDVNDIRDMLVNPRSVTIYQTATGNEGQADVVLVPCGASKGAGLLHLCSDMGIAMKDVLAIGDSDADIDMIVAAGIGVAVADGHSALKARADWVAPSAQEGGVATALKHFAVI